MRHNKETNFEKESHFAIQDRHLAIQDMNKTKKKHSNCGNFRFYFKVNMRQITQAKSFYEIF